MHIIRVVSRLGTLGVTIQVSSGIHAQDAPVTGTTGIPGAHRAGLGGGEEGRATRLSIRRSMRGVNGGSEGGALWPGCARIGSAAARSGGGDGGDGMPPACRQGPAGVALHAYRAGAAGAKAACTVASLGAAAGSSGLGTQTPPPSAASRRAHARGP